MYFQWQCLLEYHCRGSRKVWGSVALGKLGCLSASTVLCKHRANWKPSRAGGCSHSCCFGVHIPRSPWTTLTVTFTSWWILPSSVLQVCWPLCLSYLILCNSSPQAYKWHHLSRLSSSFITLAEPCFDLLPLTTVAQNEVNFWNHLGKDLLNKHTFNNMPLPFYFLHTEMFQWYKKSLQSTGVLEITDADLWLWGTALPTAAAPWFNPMFCLISAATKCRPFLIGMIYFFLHATKLLLSLSLGLKYC